MAFNIDDYTVPETKVAWIKAREEEQRKTPRKHKDAAVQIARSNELFSRTPIWWLEKPSFHRALSARARTLLFLWFKTRNGTRAVKFTGEDAADLAVSHNKMRVLRQLEADGLIIVETHGTAVPIVRMAPKAIHRDE